MQGPHSRLIHISRKGMTRMRGVFSENLRKHLDIFGYVWTLEVIVLEKLHHELTSFVAR